MCAQCVQLCNEVCCGPLIPSSAPMPRSPLTLPLGPVQEIKLQDTDQSFLSEEYRDVIANSEKFVHVFCQPPTLYSICCPVLRYFCRVCHHRHAFCATIVFGTAPATRDLVFVSCVLRTACFVTRGLLHLTLQVHQGVQEPAPGSGDAVRPHYGLVRGPTGGFLLLLLSFLFLLFLMLRSLIRTSRSISFARAQGAPLSTVRVWERGRVGGLGYIR